MEYRRPLIVGIIRASTAIAIGVNGSNPVNKNSVLQESAGPPALSRSIRGVYPADV